MWNGGRTERAIQHLSGGSSLSLIRLGSTPHAVSVTGAVYSDFRYSVSCTYTVSKAFKLHDRPDKSSSFNRNVCTKVVKNVVHVQYCINKTYTYVCIRLKACCISGFLLGLKYIYGIRNILICNLN